MKTRAYLLILEILLSLYLIACLNAGGRLIIPSLIKGHALGARLKSYPKDALITDTLKLLKNRKDNQAFQNSEQILIFEPDNIDALWIKAEVLRRQNNYKNSEELLQGILRDSPEHNP
ncbi:MAG: hypothetical protein NT033_05275, partial [Candidatus Omnitrophica bacterium]|nr:hypothetical protein [Candidatus Omnitrophota bacterium]